MDSIANWVFGLLTASGFVGFLHVTLGFFRSSKTDAVTAYADLYTKVVSRCERLEKQLSEKDEQIAVLTMEVAGLKRELAQVGISAAYLLDRK